MLVQINQLTKSYGGTHALRGINMEIETGEIHALCGENGAGKSTLIKCLTGTETPDAGSANINNRPFQFGDVDASLDAGVAVIHQESTAFPDLDAVDNIFMGRELKRFGGWFLDRPKMKQTAELLLARLQQTVRLDVPVGELSLANRQMICLARALSQQCRLLILDEPTASLSAREANSILRLCERLRDDGVSILYVSHRLEEVFTIANRVTVLRDGEKVATHEIDRLDRATLVQQMVGRRIEENSARAAGSKGTRDPMSKWAPTTSTPRLRVEGLCQAGGFQDINFEVHSGEIVGLAGLVGAGRSEVARSIFGIDTYETGRVLVDGIPLKQGSPNQAVRRKVGFVPEDRQHQGLILPLSVKANVSLAHLPQLTRWGLVRDRRESVLVEELARTLDIKSNGVDKAAGTLSGGNQQKLVIGKWLATTPRIMIVDEPTRGVDVGAKARVHELLRTLASEGMATLVVSSDLPELLEVCDRILVMREGQISGELPAATASEAAILELALPDGEQAPPHEVEKSNAGGDSNEGRSLA